LYDDPEDLGLGNSKSKPKVANGQVESPPPEAEKKSPENASKCFVQSTGSTSEIMELETPEAGATSWFSRWWKRSDSRTPIKANLGEEKSFYYDKELKRWVNKTVSSEILVFGCLINRPVTGQWRTWEAGGNPAATVKGADGFSWAIEATQI
jgi:hypothetical protein